MAALELTRSLIREERKREIQKYRTNILNMSLKLIVHYPSNDRGDILDVREMAFHPATYVRNALENISTGSHIVFF